MVFQTVKSRSWNQSIHYGVSIITIPNGSKLNENRKERNWEKERKKEIKYK